MDDETLTPLSEFILPWGHQLKVSELAYESGLKFLRLRIRQGKHRFTDIDLDAGNAAKLSELFATWAAQQPAPAEGEDHRE
jgi:hypothetical protein